MTRQEILSLAQVTRDLLIPCCEAAAEADTAHNYELGSTAGEQIEMVFAALWEHLEEIGHLNAYDRVAEIAVGDVHFLTGYNAHVFIH